ncbi:MAG TPA: molybdopterin-dependent oxidoreductase [Pirellulales bacterium]
MGKVYVDDQELEIGDEPLNGIEAARMLGIEVPHYCWHKGLTVVASCRMCLVETGTKNAETGKVAMFPKVVPACQTPAKDGTVFITNSEKVQKARALVEELLLMDHPIDCPICDKAGECLLQDYHFKYGQSERRLDVKPFSTPRRDLGDTVTLFVKRCVMCTRCVRFTREVSGTSELMVVKRGNSEEIDVFRDTAGNPIAPLKNKLSGNVVDLCPVGALGDKDFLYKQRVWYMKSHKGVCAGCSQGCSIHVDENQDHVYRLKPRENQAINKWWMCDEGRYGWQYVNREDRFRGPWQRDGQNWNHAEWTVLIPKLRAELEKAGKLAALFSPFMTVEEAYVLAKLMRELDPNAFLALGPVPVEGTDESFPGGFTIRAEKCPNKKGVSEVLKSFGALNDYDAFLAKCDSGEVQGVWVSAGYKEPWVDEAAALKISRAPLVIVSDLFRSPLSEKAKYVLPATAFTEKDGSFVNTLGILQSFRWSVRSPGACRAEAGVIQQLRGVKGLYKSGVVLAEVAREAPFFGAVSDGVPELGLDLKVNQLAGAGVGGASGLV